MAKKLRFAIIAGLFVAFAGRAEVPGPSVIATPPQPQWSELTVEQKVILAPLSDDWDAMEYYRQKKWLGITRRFASLTPAEQRRIQEQMQAWGKLTPEQRNVARENFKTASKLPAEKKEELRQKWEEYSSLPQEERERLNAQAVAKSAPRTGAIWGSSTVLSVPPKAPADPLGNPPSVVTPPVSLPNAISAPVVEATRTPPISGGASASETETKH